MFEIDEKNRQLTKLNSPAFAESGFRERADLQEWIANQPNCLGEELLIIQKEFAGFEGTQERLDLLALDKQGRLVIIENKLDDSGRDVVWQALKYVAYCSTLKQSEIIDIYQKYLNQQHDDGDAKEKIYDFLGFDSENTDEEIILNESVSQRLILVAAKFHKAVTSTILWLIENGINAECIEVKLYQSGDHKFLDVNKIIPTKGSEDYVIKKASKISEERQVKTGNSKTNERNFKFWKKLLSYFKEQSEQSKESNSHPYYNISPREKKYLQASTGIHKEFFYWLVYNPTEIQVVFIMHSQNEEENKKIYDYLENNHKDKIEQEYGESLIWNRGDGFKSSKIYFKENFDGLDEANWKNMFNWLYKNFQKFENIFDSLKSDIKEELQKIND